MNLTFYSLRGALLHGIGLAFIVLSLTLLSAQSAQAAACPVTDGGAGDGDGTANGIITINANTTWTPSDATAWDCSGLDIVITNNSTLTFGSNTSSGYYGYLQADNLQIDNGAAISSNARGCPGFFGWSGGGPNTSTNVCGQYVSGYGRIGGGASGAGHGGAGGAGSTMSTVGTTYGSSTAPVLFGSSGGGENNFGPQTTGGAGGGIVRLSISENFLFNGSISANGGNGTTGGYGYAAGGGSGGSIYIVVSGAISGSTGSLSATGGAGGNNTSDGGGGGGGRISISGNDQTSFLSALSASVVVAGGSGPDSAADGSTGSLDTSLLYSRPSTPSLSSPLAASYNNSVNLNITSSSYSSNGAAHTTSDWMLKTSNNCATNDDRVWYKNDDSGNKTSITVNTTNGTFTGALSGQTALASNTQYYACVRHSNLSGDSDWSTARSFTTVFAGSASSQIWDFVEDAAHYTYDSDAIELNAGLNSLVRLKDAGGGTYVSASTLSGWTKRKPITITNGNASTLTNHQVRMDVTYDADMQADFDDLRFINVGGDLLDYWIETKTDGVSAVVWVEVGELAASSGTTVYMYYGNGAATSASNGSNTFVYFDDFESYTTDSNINGQGGWVTGRMGGTGYAKIAELNGTKHLLTKSTSGSTAVHRSLNTDTSGYAIRAKVYASTWGEAYMLNFHDGTYQSGGDIANGYQTVLGGWSNTQGTLRYAVSSVISESLFPHSFSNGSSYTLDFSWVGTSFAVFQNNSSLITRTMSDFASRTHVGMGVWTGQDRYTDWFLVREAAASEPTSSFGSEVGLATYDEVKVMPAAGGTHPEYTALYGFSESLGGGNQGLVRYQISNDSINWYYFDAGTGDWSPASDDAVHNNTATLVNAYLPKFSTDVGLGDFYVKAFLISNGSQRVELDSISLSYSPPVILDSITITDNSGYTNDATPVITLSSSGATPSHVAFSCNGGGNWSAWLTYPDDNVVNDDDGPAFNMTSDATGCSGSDGLKTIHTKIKNANSESGSVSDSTTLDTLAPTVVSVSSPDANGTYGATEVITVSVQFTDATMQVTGTPQIQLDMDGTDRQANYASTNTDTLSFTYTIATGDNKTDLDYTGTGALTLNGGTIADRAGNTATLTLATPGAAGSLGANKALNIVTNQTPTVASVTGVQSANGDGDVTITFIMDDSDDDNTLQAKVEYSLDGGDNWSDPTLSTAGADTSATFGDPSVNNAVEYQVGQAGAYITSSSGANTVTIVWEAGTDLSSSINIANARIRITPYDGTVAGTAGSSANFVLDRVAPTGLSGFSHGDFASDRATLTWTAASDNNFSHYEIWSSAIESHAIGRNGTAVEWDNDNDATLSNASTTSTTINNTDPRNKFFKIFAMDNYGNELTVATVYIGGGQSSVTSSSGSSGGGGGGGGGGSSFNNDDEEVTEPEENTDPEEDPVVIIDDEDEGVEEEVPADVDWDDLGIDQPDHWSSGYVKYLQEQNNILEVAVTEPTFMDILLGIFTTPDAKLDRAQALEFLIVIAGYDIQVMTLNTRTMAFTDVPADHERAAFIQFGFEQGLIHGYPDGTFQPEMTINRVEALKMTTVFFEGDWTRPVYGDELLELYGLDVNPFSDVDLNAWYAPYLINAYSKGVVNGYGDGTFGPGNHVTYAEFLKIATLMKNIEEAVELAEELQ